MPELPEVETTKTSLEPLLGQRVKAVTVDQPRLRWPVPNDLSRLEGQRLVRLERRAKYILAYFEQDTLLLHLGMSGSFRLGQADDPRRKHDHVTIDFEQHQLRYHDPRRFGCILWHNDYAHLLSHLGPEPLTDDFSAKDLQHKLAHKNTPIKVALMDNTIVVGVGNIYATEALFHAGVHPARAAKSLNRAEIEAVVGHIKRILQHSIELGGSTLRDFVNGQGETGYFQQTLWVYGRANQPCQHCQTTIETLKLGQRASAYCPKCQPDDKSR